VASANAAPASNRFNGLDDKPLAKLQHSKKSNPSKSIDLLVNDVGSH
jgi:hypothetical protein